MPNNKYFWIKLKLDFFSLPEIDFLLSQQNGSDYVVLYQMLCLMSVNENGSLANHMNEILVPFDVDKIRRDTKHFSKDTIIVALSLFSKLGLVYEETGIGVLKISCYDNLIGQETLAAKYKRNYRAKKKEETNHIENKEIPLDPEKIKIARTRWVNERK